MSLKELFNKTRRYHLLVPLAAAAAVTLMVQVQHLVSLGRYQHYALAIGLFALGYLLQAVYSWRDTPTWTRVSYIATGSFFMSVAIIFYQNPWLDFKVAVQTEDRERFRSLLVCIYLSLSFVLAAIWFKMIHEDSKLKKKHKQESAGQNTHKAARDPEGGYL